MFSNTKKNVVIDIDRMKYPNTGMYSFCLSLMQEFLKLSVFHFIFYKHSKTELDKRISIINIKPWDNFFLFPNKKINLWHTTNQLSKRIPKGNFKFVYTIHDLNFLYSNKSESKKEKLLKKIQQNCDKAHKITFISCFAYQDSLQHLKLDKKKCLVVYNGVSLKEFPDFNSPKIIPEGEFIFTLSVIDPKKNIHVNLNLLIGNQLYFVISGIVSNESYKNQIINEAKKLNVYNRIIFTNAISEEEKYWYLKNCKAFVFTSISEGFGLPPIEAMRLGKPVFLSTHTSLPEVGGNVAYYFKDFEAKNMQQTFKDGLKDYHTNNKVEIIKNWSNQFSWEKAAIEYCKIYQELLD